MVKKVANPAPGSCCDLGEVTSTAAASDRREGVSEALADNRSGYRLELTVVGVRGFGLQSLYGSNSFSPAITTISGVRV
jgi:hypothetical protein